MSSVGYHRGAGKCSVPAQSQVPPVAGTTAFVCMRVCSPSRTWHSTAIPRFPIVPRKVPVWTAHISRSRRHSCYLRSPGDLHFVRFRKSHFAVSTQVLDHWTSHSTGHKTRWTFFVCAVWLIRFPVELAADLPPCEMF